MDEAGFGRISKPYYCWCAPGIRPCIPCHHIREYRHAYGAAEPVTGDSQFLVMPNCDTDCMNVFLEHLSKQYPDEQILLLITCTGDDDHRLVVAARRLRDGEGENSLTYPRGRS